MTLILFTILTGAFARDLGVTCEHALMNSPALVREVETQILDRIFMMSGREDGVRPEAYRHLKLPPGLSDKSWHNVILSVHRPRPRLPEDLILRVGRFVQGEVHWNLEMGWLDDTPVLWRVMNLSRAQSERPYDEILARHPLGPLGREMFETEFIGYATDPDVNGVRTYVAARAYPDEENVTIDLGLDVPCGSWDKYAGPAAEARLVRSSSTTYCRLSMLSFYGVHLTGEEPF